MKKSYIFLFAFVLLTFNSIVYAQEDSALVGGFERDALLESPYNKWFVEEYKTYTPDSAVLKSVSLETDIELLIFLGTWCSDSRREVPRFIKILDELSMDFDKVELQGLNRQKTAPDYPENIWNIEYVPTFIFLKNGKEIGRIIETPIISLEEDTKDILTKK